MTREPPTPEEVAALVSDLNDLRCLGPHSNPDWCRAVCDRVAALVAALIAAQQERIAELEGAPAWLAGFIVERMGGTNDIPAWVRRSAEYWDTHTRESMAAEERAERAEAARDAAIKDAERYWPFVGMVGMKRPPRGQDEVDAYEMIRERKRAAIAARAKGSA